MNEQTVEVVALLAVIGLGLLLGKISWRGISLGTSGVVFVALAAGHFGFAVPRIAGVAGIILFAYCLGIGAGPSFLRMLFRQGTSLAVMAVSMILAAGVAAYLAALALDLSPGLASGLFAGALTSTPALAAATDRLPESTEVAVGFGIAYPFGVIGVILFVQLAPRLFSQGPGLHESEVGPTLEDGPITRVLVNVVNPSVVGRRLRDLASIARSNCQVSRLLVDNNLQPIPSSFCLATGQRVLVVGAEQRIPEIVEVLGERCDATETEYVLDLERQRRRVVVTSAQVVGQSLANLHLLSRFGVTISRITRQDIEFVPSPQERIQFGDALIAVGEADGLDQFVAFAGHRERTLDETDLISLTVGLVLGVLAGSAALTFGDKSISLGLAGGPLLVGLVLGHLGHIGPIVGRMPRAARFLLADIGLALFLGRAGSQAGEDFVTVIGAYGMTLPLAAITIVAIPLFVGTVVARFVLRIEIWETLGSICGAMTSTPGLGAVTSQVDSSLPATSYATVYPVALILITLVTPLLILQVPEPAATPVQPPATAAPPDLKTALVPAPDRELRLER